MAIQVHARDDDGNELNASVDLDDGYLIFHSRSGTARNRDYRAALETILFRLDQAGLDYDIFLDSQPVQLLPLEQRKLVFSHRSPVPERFNEIVRAMNAESSKNGAWRRLRISVPARA